LIDFGSIDHLQLGDPAANQSIDGCSMVIMAPYIREHDFIERALLRVLLNSAPGLRAPEVAPAFDIYDH
jgi:hypothetical protein